MSEYNIAGEKVIIPLTIENERYVRNKTDKLLDRVGDIFDTWYSSQGDCNSVYKNADIVLNKAIMPIIEKGVRMLNDQGVYSIDKYIFVSKYVPNYADDFYDALETMRDAINSVDSQARLEKEYREMRKASRGRVIGGGFGFGGAIKGMATAGVMNATTGAAHSLGNALGNMGSNMSAISNKANIYKYSKDSLRDSIIHCAVTVRHGIRTALGREANVKCKSLTLTDVQQEEAIITNFMSDRIPDSKKKEQLLLALQLNPFDSKMYILIWDEYGDKTGDLVKMATYFGYSLEEDIPTLANSHGKNLFEKNCKSYINAFNKLTAAIDNEESIKTTLDMLLKYCVSHNIPEESIPHIEECKQLLGDIDKSLRTIDGIEYNTRELADNIRNDYSTFYKTLSTRNIYDRKTYDAVIAANYTTSEFRSLIDNLYCSEGEKRTPKKLYANILKLLEKNLNKDTFSTGWVSIPDLLGNYPSRLSVIKSAITLPTNEVPLIVFDRTSNGKSGLLITNTSIRIYSKGVFSGESKCFPIEEFTKMECVNLDEYYIYIKDQDPIKISFKQKELSVEEQIALGETITKIIVMINNLLAHDRIHLYRILHGTFKCICGAYFLPGETICPSCRRMLRETGELVETQICPSCKLILPIGKKFCSRCGYPIATTNSTTEPINNPSQKICPKCNKLLKPEQKFCSTCGTKV